MTTQRWPWEGAHLDGEPLPKINPAEVKRAMRAIATIVLAAFAEEEVPVKKRRKAKKVQKRYLTREEKKTTKPRAVTKSKRASKKRKVKR